MEVLCEAPVETPGRAETATPTLRHWEDGWALHYLTDPAQHCRSRSRHTGPDSVERERGENNVERDLQQTLSVFGKGGTRPEIYLLPLPLSPIPSFCMVTSRGGES